MARVEAVFFDKAKATEVYCREIYIPASAAGQEVGKLMSCMDHAWRNAFTHFALDIDGEWHIFEVPGLGRRTQIATVKSKEAAEMWLVHCVR